jgi:hypothetical protein
LGSLLYCIGDSRKNPANGGKRAEISQSAGNVDGARNVNTKYNMVLLQVNMDRCTAVSGMRKERRQWCDNTGAAGFVLVYV